MCINDIFDVKLHLQHLITSKLACGAIYFGMMSTTGFSESTSTKIIKVSDVTKNILNQKPQQQSQVEYINSIYYLGNKIS